MKIPVERGVTWFLILVVAGFLCWTVAENVRLRHRIDDVSYLFRYERSYHAQDVANLKKLQREVIELQKTQREPTPFQERREKIKEAMKSAWKSNQLRASGFEELMPSSWKGIKYGGQDLSPDVSIVDSLDTLYIMGLHKEFSQSTALVANRLDFSQVPFTRVSETSVKVLEALLSAYDLSGNNLFLNKSQELAGRLFAGMSAFYRMFASNSRRGASIKDLIPSSEEIKFLALARRIGVSKYVEYLSVVTERLYEKFPIGGLLPRCISSKPLICTEDASANGGASLYANLLKIWMLDLETPGVNHFRDAWEESMMGLLSLFRESTPSSQDVHGPALRGNDKSILPKINEVVCVAPGMLALGANDTSPGKSIQYLRTAEELAKTCYSLHIPSQACPDDRLYVKYGQVMSLASAERQYLGPKTIESFFYLWRKTGDAMYRDLAWNIFKTFDNISTVYSGDSTATTLPALESVSRTKTLKYLYLFYSPSSVMPLNEWVFNTEGHPIKIRDRTKGRLTIPDFLPDVSDVSEGIIQSVPLLKYPE